MPLLLLISLPLFRKFFYMNSSKKLRVSDVKLNIFGEYKKNIFAYQKNFNEDHGMTPMLSYKRGSAELKNYGMNKYLLTEDEVEYLKTLYGKDEYSAELDRVANNAKIYQSRFFHPIFYLPFEEVGRDRIRHRKYKPYYNYFLDPRKDVLIPEFPKFNTFEIESNVGNRTAANSVYLFRCQQFSSVPKIEHESYSKSYTWFSDLARIIYCNGSLKNYEKKTEVVAYKLLDNLNLLILNAETIKLLADLTERLSSNENLELFRKFTGYGITDSSHRTEDIGGPRAISLYSYINKPENVIRFLDAGNDYHFGSWDYNNRESKENFVPQIHEEVIKLLDAKKKLKKAALGDDEYMQKILPANDRDFDITRLLNTPPSFANKIFFRFVQMLLAEFKKAPQYNKYFYKSQYSDGGDYGFERAASPSNFKNIDGIIYDPYLMLETERIDDYYLNEWNTEIIFFDPIVADRKLQRSHVNPEETYTPFINGKQASDPKATRTAETLISQSNIAQKIADENEKMSYARQFEKNFSFHDKLFFKEVYQMLEKEEKSNIPARHVR